MGSKTVTKVKLRNGAYKCDLCGRRMMSLEGLVSHQKCLHNVSNILSKPRTQKPAILKSKHIAVKPKILRTAPKQKVLVTKPRVVESKQVQKAISKSPSPEKEEKSEMAPVSKKKVEFECPNCEQTFPAYFSAHKHIQKHHCVNCDGEAVAPNSAELIKPIRKEPCMKCDGVIRSDDPHTCILKEQAGMTYVCSGCNHSYMTLRLFDLHVGGMHSDSVVSLFFPSKKEFNSWKREMELQMDVSYFILGNGNDTKQYYRCNYVNENGLGTNVSSLVCPSTIVVQEFTKGIQVHFYKDHFNHDFNEYELTEQYKKYSITTFFKKNAGVKADSKSEKHHLYQQFKAQMESIINDAEKVNISRLKVLLNKAMVMTSVITDEAYNEPFDSTDNISLTDSQISEALEEIQAVDADTNKRKQSLELPSPDIVAKRTRRSIFVEKNQTTSPMIVNSFSLANKDIQNKLFDELLQDNDVNDTKENKEAKTNDGKIKEPVKPLEDSDSKKKDVDVKSVKKDTIEDKSKKKDDDRAKVKASKGKPIPSFNDTYKDFVNQINGKTDVRPTRPRKPPPIKTKMGQFKPSLSPKKSPTATPSKASDKPKSPKVTFSKSVSPKVTPTKPVRPMKSHNTPKKPVIPSKKPRLSRTPDIKYEVREQENDCNILVLKI